MRVPLADRRVLLLAAGLLWAVISLTPVWGEVSNPNGVAVIIGNRSYRHDRVPEVSYAHRDAAAFKRYVLDVLGYDPLNLIELEDASQADLESAFGNERSHEGLLWRYLDPDGGSDVVVFYSGHGVPGLKDGRGYLLPSDARPDTAEINGYPIDLLYENLLKLQRGYLLNLRVKVPSAQIAVWRRSHIRQSTGATLTAESPGVNVLRRGRKTPD